MCVRERENVWQDVRERVCEREGVCVCERERESETPCTFVCMSYVLCHERVA